MSFNIAFTGDHDDDDPLVAIGKIQLADRRQVTFSANVAFWPVQRYQDSWIAALRRLSDGAGTSCLLTSVSKPEEANFITAMELYRFGDIVRVQDRHFFLTQHPDFDLDAPWEAMDPYSDVNDDGEPITPEWQVAMADIDDFLARTTTQTGSE